MILTTSINQIVFYLFLGAAPSHPSLSDGDKWEISIGSIMLGGLVFTTIFVFYRRRKNNALDQLRKANAQARLAVYNQNTNTGPDILSPSMRAFNANPMNESQLAAGVQPKSMSPINESVFRGADGGGNRNMR